MKPWRTVRNHRNIFHNCRVKGTFYVLQNPEAVKKINDFDCENFKIYSWGEKSKSKVKYEMTNWKKLFVTHIIGKR